jgi:hypothetical protein
MANIQIPVAPSTNIKEVHYDEETQTLTTKLNGGTYTYHPVPQSAVQALSSADSSGKHFFSFIKNNPKYTVKKIG